MSRMVSVVVAASVLLTPAAALASHGKAGLWSSTTTMDLPGAGPQTRTTTYCMTAAEVAGDTPPSTGNPSCKYVGSSMQGHTFTADMVCTGQVSAKGHLVTTYDSDTHYTGEMTITGGQNMTFVNKYEGKWLKDDCAGAEH